MHAGYGVNVVGHGNPPWSRRCSAGSRSAPTSPSRPRTRSWSPRAARERFGLPMWRFTNSGTEATMDAVHLMRAITGRDADRQDRGQLPRPPRHGDGVAAGAASTSSARSSDPHRVRRDPGIPQAMADLVRIVPFNDLDGARACVRGQPRPDRRHDHRADDDERRHHPARSRLPRGCARDSRAGTVRC